MILYNILSHSITNVFVLQTHKFEAAYIETLSRVMSGEVGDVNITKTSGSQKFLWVHLGDVLPEHINQ